MGDHGDPPELSVRIPQTRALPEKTHKFSENFVIDFLLLTVVEWEFLSCFLYLQEPLKFYDKKTGFVYVGKMGDETEQEKLTIGLMKCDMGSGVGGSTVTVQNAVTSLNPKGVFCVGFCGGMNATKAKLGDVVVSAKLSSYALWVYTAAHNLQIEWVIVKGISDYADGTKDSTKDWKPYASVMAASLVAHVLRQPSIFKDWPRYDEGSTKRGPDSQGWPDQSTAGPSKKRCIPRKCK